MKYAVIDTNIHLLDPKFYLQYQDYVIVIPWITIQELDKKKSSPGILGVNARKALKTISKISQLMEYVSPTSINKIVETDGCKFLIYEDSFIKEIIPNGFNMDLADDRIITTAFQLFYLSDNKTDEVVLLSNDCSVRTKTSIYYSKYKVKSLEFNPDKVNINDYYKTEDINISDELVSKLYENKLTISDVELDNYSVNTTIYLRSNGKCIISKIESDGRILPIDEKSTYRIKSIKPINEYQKALVNYIKDDKIKIVGCIGISGSGKTLIALSTALQDLEDGKYSQIKLIKPYVSLGNTVGYLKGDLEQKIDPIRKSFDSALEILGESIDNLESTGKLTFSVPEFERGNTYHNTILIIDECQNLTNMEIKSLITRCSESSKVILLGDTKQIDSLYLNENYNGLSYVIDKLQGQEFFASIYLNKSERASFINIIDELL